jgi:nucleoside-triphosphatase
MLYLKQTDIEVRQSGIERQMDALPCVKNLLLTGRPGSGKTTIVSRATEGAASAGGFFTGEVRENGVRTGFSIRTLDGRSGTLASVGTRSPVKVSRYGVNLHDVDEVAAASVERAVRDDAADLVVIDEIGAMEIASERFRAAVREALDCPKRVLGTIQMKENQFLDLVRARQDVHVERVDSSTREVLPGLVRDWLDLRPG